MPSAGYADLHEACLLFPCKFSSSSDHIIHTQTRSVINSYSATEHRRRGQNGVIGTTASLDVPRTLLQGVTYIATGGADGHQICASCPPLPAAPTNKRHFSSYRLISSCPQISFFFKNFLPLPRKIGAGYLPVSKARKYSFLLWGGGNYIKLKLLRKPSPLL